MHDQAFITLEFEHVCALIRRNTQTPMGALLVDALKPLEDPHQLKSALLAVAECVQVKRRGGSWSFAELRQPQEAIARLRVEGAALESTAILELATLCSQAMSARASIVSEREACPVLCEIVRNLPRELNALVARVSNKILPSGDLDDRASPELARIRHEISRLRSSITRSLENLMRKSEEVIQDELVTVRNDRFVIPVKSDHRSRIHGVAHGFSSSGATAFIEPLETIEANNELQGLREAEQREISKILFGLTEDLRAQLAGIEWAADAVAQLDFLNAKAAFLQRFNCVIPEIEQVDIDDGAASRRPTLKLIDARHPLLEENLRESGDSVVPVSLSLDKEHDSMIISGANAGGKTVVLKTAGLLSLLALSGLPVPAREARVPLYASVLADIGDHQSLAANLSTFTSHVSNISRMIEICESPALVLLDEVGTGTDPEEGSALGVAVVDHFRKDCGAQVLATTHYGGLKMYAANEEGVLNASVEFDEKTLKPTYRLIVGIAGASAGLEIAQRFGISRSIINAASRLVKDSSMQARQYLDRIKQESEAAATLRQALEEERAAVAEEFASLDKQAQKREREREKTFLSELDQMARDFDRRSREVLANIQDQSERIKLERETQRRMAELKRDVQRRISPKQAAESASERPIRVVRDGRVVQGENIANEQANPLGKSAEEAYIISNSRAIQVGDTVRLRAFGSIGIVDQIKDDEAEIRVKSLRFREKLESLDLVESSPKAKTEKTRFGKLREPRTTQLQVNRPAENLAAELNVIGQRSDEAVAAVDKFLDQAFINSVTQVRIVHGHGTGALRRAIGELLKDHPHVERFLPAPPDQGGTGATVVQLRN